MNDKNPTVEMIAAADINQLRKMLAAQNNRSNTEWIIVSAILARITRLQDEELNRRGPRPLIDFVMPVITIMMALWIIIGPNVPPC